MSDEDKLSEQLLAYADVVERGYATCVPHRRLVFKKTHDDDPHAMEAVANVLTSVVSALGMKHKIDPADMIFALHRTATSLAESTGNWLALTVALEMSKRIAEDDGDDSVSDPQIKEALDAVHTILSRKH